MIPEVDEALRSLLRSRAALDKQVEVAFDAPAGDWAAAQNAPAINAYLYDIREDMPRREYGMIPVRDETGAVVQRQRPLRYFRLSYLVTCWTRQTEDEHRLLASVLGCLIETEVLPLTGPGELASSGLPVRLVLSEPSGDTGSAADIWTALGGSVKPSICVVAIAPYPVTSAVPAAPAVTEAAGVVGRRTDVPGRADRLRLRRVSQ